MLCLGSVPVFDVALGTTECCAPSGNSLFFQSSFASSRRMSLRVEASSLYVCPTEDSCDSPPVSATPSVIRPMIPIVPSLWKTMRKPPLSCCPGRQLRAGPLTLVAAGLALDSWT